MFSIECMHFFERIDTDDDFRRKGFRSSLPTLTYCYIAIPSRNFIQIPAVVIGSSDTVALVKSASDG